MGSLIPPELSLDSRFSSKAYVHKTIGEFVAEVSRIHSASERILKLEDYVNRLQDEMKKIDAFKRELPLCMLLLSDGGLLFPYPFISVFHIDLSFLKTQMSSGDGFFRFLFLLSIFRLQGFFLFVLRYV